jgi:hypothetical protein
VVVPDLGLGSVSASLSPAAAPLFMLGVGPPGVAVHSRVFLWDRDRTPRV